MPARRKAKHEHTLGVGVVLGGVVAYPFHRVGCLQKGLRIPDDISIIAFNNSLYAQLASPQLTAVDVNSFLLGQEAANQIINHAENPNLTTSKVVVPHAIVERASCRQWEEAQ